MLHLNSGLLWSQSHSNEKPVEDPSTSITNLVNEATAQVGVRSNAFLSSALTTAASFKGESLCNNWSDSNTRPDFYLSLLNLQSPFPVTLYKAARKAGWLWALVWRHGNSSRLQSPVWVHMWPDLTLSGSLRKIFVVPLLFLFFSRPRACVEVILRTKNIKRCLVPRCLGKIIDRLTVGKGPFLFRRCQTP